MQVPPEKLAQARHVTRSWLRYFGAEDLPITHHPGEGVYVDPLKIISPKPQDIEMALDPVARALGRTLSLPPIPERIDGDYEGAYLRQRQILRCPPPDPKEVERYRPTVERSARAAHRRFFGLASSIGFEAEDFISLGMMHLTVFLHYYAYHGPHNERFLYSFLRQRFSEWAKISVRKSRSLTCLSEETVTDAEKVFPLIEAEMTSPDAEYEPGSYLLIGPDGERSVEALSDGFFSLAIWEDGRRLSKEEVDDLGQQILSGEVTVIGPIYDNGDEERTGVGHRNRARRELERRLLEMPLEQRETVLSMAALSKFVDPVVRREARRLCRERRCEPCKVNTMEFVCPSCGSPTALKYGVDPEKFREKAVDMEDSFVARDDYRRKAIAATQAAEERAVGGGRMPKEEADALAEKLRRECFESLPDFLTCPRCKETKEKAVFGIRVSRSKASGKPLRAARQSHCRPCRSKS